MCSGHQGVARGRGGGAELVHFLMCTVSTVQVYRCTVCTPGCSEGARRCRDCAFSDVYSMYSTGVQCVHQGVARGRGDVELVHFLSLASRDDPS